MLPCLLVHRYYSAYLDYYKKIIAERDGISSVIEEYVASPKANVSSYGGEDPEMLGRFLSGLVHPIIHAAYGLEFDIPGIVAEGKLIFIPSCSL
jgi:hypothetical protein